MQNLAAAIKQIAAERGIDQDKVLDAIKHSIKVSFQNEYPEEIGASLEVEIDEDNEESLAVYADKKVVELVTSPPTQISLEDAQKIEPKLKLGDHVWVEITHTGDFGRIAAQAARQVITQMLREAEKEAVMQQFTDKIGTVDTATAQRKDREGNILFEIYRATAKMPPEEQIPGEFYKSGEKYKVLLKEIAQDAKGKILIVSRGDAEFLRSLFEMEVPEISTGTVEITGISREAGSRSKVAVKSNAEGVDPIGACVGQRGVRISAITNELKTQRGEEKIDIIPSVESDEDFIANAVKPAEALEVKVINREDKQALILVDDEDLSLAIGKEGQNVRLAAKLTGWKLDIQGKQQYKDNESKSKFEMEDSELESDEQVATPEAADEAISSQPVTDSQDNNVEEDKEVDTAEEESGGLAALQLPARVETAIEKAGVTDVEELKQKIEAGEKIEGVGEKSMQTIKEALG